MKILNWLSDSPSRFFLLVAIPVISILVFLLPPFQAPDEPTHLYKIVQLSDGHLRAAKLDGNVGSYLPEKYLDTANQYLNTRINLTEKTKLSLTFHNIAHPDHDNNRVFTHFENTAVYPPLPYIPQVITFSIARIFTGSVVLQLYAARIGTAITYILLCYWAIRLLSFGKWGATAIALILFIAASSADDGVIMSLCLFTVAIAVRTYQRARLSPRQLYPLFACFIALSLCKSPYYIFSFLALGLPLAKFKDRRQQVFSMVGLILPPLLIAILWNAAIKNILINVYPGANTTQQAEYIKHHSFRTLRVLVRSITFSATNNTLPQQSIDLENGAAASFPQWFIIGNYIMLSAALIFAPKKIKPEIAKFNKWLALTIAAVGSLVVSGLLYLTFTPVGSNIVEGLQGRYFVPFVSLFIIALGGYIVLQKQQYEKVLRVLCCFMILGGVFAVYGILARYYLPGYSLLSS